MGSPLRGVLACIYLEFLESGPFKYIIPNNSNYVRYIDDILFTPKELNLIKIPDRLNNTELSIKSTNEFESKNSLPFLDVL